MKTEYHIIWVDDDIDSVATDIRDTEDFFEKFGIKAHIKTFQSETVPSIHEAIGASLKNPELDLLVVDFMMDGMNGRELINLIRQSDHIFLPVIFYSAAGTEKLHQEAASAALDGVYIAHRDRVRDKIGEVATSLLRKEQTTKRTRGLLMEGVSEIDANFGELFGRMWAKLNDENKLKIVKYLREKLGERAKRAASAVDELPGELATFKKMMDETFVSVNLDTQTRWKVIKKMLELSGHDAASTKVFLRLFEHSEAPGPLVPLRNIYGHKTRAQLEPEHNQDKCVAIRREVRTQTSNIGKMIKDSE
jgi:CheY-like chemotaxis protein